MVWPENVSDWTLAATAPILPPRHVRRPKIDSKEFIQHAIVGSFKQAWADREPVLLLAGLALCVKLVIFAPVRAFLIELQRMQPENEEQLRSFLIENEGALGSFLLITLAFSFILSFVQTVLARLADERKPPVFEGGVGRYLLRGIHVFWRELCTAGWLLVLLLPFGMAAAGIGGEVMSVVFSLALIAALFPLLAALSFAISAAAVDQAYSIRGAFRALGSYRMRFIGLTFVLIVSAQVLTGLVNAVVSALGLYELSAFIAAALIDGLNFLFIFFAFSVWFGVASRIRLEGPPSGKSLES